MLSRVMAPAFALSAALGLLVTGTTTASASTPVIHFEQTASFTVGQSLGPSTRNSDTSSDYTSLPMQLNWSATPTKSVCSYDLSDSGVGFSHQAVLRHTTATTYRYEGTNYDDAYGGQLYGVLQYFLAAHTCGGATLKQQTQSFAPTVIEDDGYQVSAYAVPAHVSYNGKWGVAHCACFSANTSHWTTQPGATGQLVSTTTAGAHLGVVMNKGGNRGIAKIYLDQQLVATVNTQSASSVNRVIVYSSPSLTAGTHTIKVVNASSGSNLRVDLDAFVQENRA